MKKKANPSEVVYVNGGEIYKATAPFDLGKTYTPDPTGDGIFQFKKNDGKRYLFTQEFREFFGETGGEVGVLDDIDLCPAVDLWICLGAPSVHERSNFDVFFAVNSTEQLAQVAEYYGLPYPITDQVGVVLDHNPASILFWNVGGRPIVPAGVKFIGGKPALLKLYTYPREHGAWNVWMYGASYFDHGQCWEAGAVYQKQTGGADVPGAQMRGSAGFRKAEIIRSKRADGIEVTYEYTRGAEDKDPAIFWKGVERDAQGAVTRIKRYESSKMVRKALYRMTSGTELERRDLCPAVNLWLGRSFYDDSTEEELLFCIQSRAMLDQVAEYYGLPVPYDSEQQQILDTNLQLYRARHYDLLGLGAGNHVPVVVGGVVTVNGVPSRLLLYTFLRQWECEEQIVLPDLGINRPLE